MTTLFGIKNCDTVKKARKWLDSNEQTYTFHDFRSDGIEQSHLEDWLGKVDASLLINKRSTTWKQLSEQEKALFDSASLSPEALAIILAQPTLIKRPVLEIDSDVHVGFKADQYSSIFS